jgi:hypothetical protein
MPQVKKMIWQWENENAVRPHFLLPERLQEEAEK